MQYFLTYQKTLHNFKNIANSSKNLYTFRIDLTCRVGYYCRRSGLLKMGLRADLLLVYSRIRYFFNIYS